MVDKENTSDSSKSLFFVEISKPSDLTQSIMAVNVVIGTLNGSTKKSRYRSLAATYLEIAEGFIARAIEEEEN